jgi:hypothetical protein
VSDPAVRRSFLVEWKLGPAERSRSRQNDNYSAPSPPMNTCPSPTYSAGSTSSPVSELGAPALYVAHAHLPTTAAEVL